MVDVKLVVTVEDDAVEVLTFYKHTEFPAVPQQGDYIHDVVLSRHNDMTERFLNVTAVVYEYNSSAVVVRCERETANLFFRGKLGRSWLAEVKDAGWQIMNNKEQE
jgi:hypothetical protein